MSLDVFNACIKGYSNRLFDLQIISVQTGYWAGYFTRAKKPKSLKSILNSMVKAKSKEDKSSDKSIKAPEVDVDAFLAMEKRFQERRRNQNK